MAFFLFTTAEGRSTAFPFDERLEGHLRPFLGCRGDRPLSTEEDEDCSSSRPEARPESAERLLSLLLHSEEEDGEADDFLVHF